MKKSKKGYTTVNIMKLRKSLLFFTILSLTALAASSTIGDFQVLNNLSVEYSGRIENVFSGDQGLYSYYFDGFNSKGYLTKIGSNLSVEWKRELPGAKFDEPVHIKTLEDGKVAIIGENIKILNQNGEYIDQFSLDGFELNNTYYDREYEIQEAKLAYDSGNLFGAVLSDNKYRSVFFKVFKIDSNRLRWKRSIKALNQTEGHQYPEIKDLEISNNSVYVVGTGQPDGREGTEEYNLPGNPTGNDYDWFISSFSRKGKIEWTRFDTSGKGEDIPLKAEVINQTLHVYGEYPNFPRFKLREVSYSRENEIVDERITPIEPINIGDEKLFLHSYSFEEGVKKAEIDKKKLKKKISKQTGKNYQKIIDTKVLTVEEDSYLAVKTQKEVLIAPVNLNEINYHLQKIWYIIQEVLPW